MRCQLTTDNDVLTIPSFLKEHGFSLVSIYRDGNENQLSPWLEFVEAD